MLKEDLVGDRCGVEMGTGTGGEGGQEGTKIVLKVCPLSDVLKGLPTLSIQYMYLNTGRHKQTHAQTVYTFDHTGNQEDRRRNVHTSAMKALPDTDNSGMVGLSYQ